LEPYEFDSFEVPPSLRGRPVECRFFILDEEGNYIASSYDQSVGDPGVLRSALNVLPLRFVEAHLHLVYPQATS
jgi:hypothetical protein